jgi:hypothetical protein
VIPGDRWAVLRCASNWISNELYSFSISPILQATQRPSRECPFGLVATAQVSTGICNRTVGLCVEVDSWSGASEAASGRDMPIA